MIKSAQWITASRNIGDIRKVSKYTEQVFRMYGDRTEKVTLQFDKKLIGTIYDKFGEKTK